MSVKQLKRITNVPKPLMEGMNEDHTPLLETQNKFFNLLRKDYNNFFNEFEKDTKKLAKEGFYMLKKDCFLKEIVSKKNYNKNNPQSNAYRKNTGNRSKSPYNQNFDSPNNNLYISKNNNYKKNNFGDSNSNFNKNLYSSDGFSKKPIYPIKFESIGSMTSDNNLEFKIINKRSSDKKVNELNKKTKSETEFFEKLPNKLIYFRKPELIKDYLIEKENKVISEEDEEMEKNLYYTTAKKNRIDSFEKINDIIRRENIKSAGSLIGPKRQNKSLDFIIEKNLSKKDIEKYNLQRKLNKKDHIALNQFIFKNFDSSHTKSRERKIDEMISVTNYSNLRIVPRTSHDTKKRMIISNGNNERNYLLYPKTAKIKTNKKATSNEDKTKIQTSYIKRFFSSDTYYLSPKNIDNFSSINKQDKESLGNSRKFIFQLKKIPNLPDLNNLKENESMNKNKDKEENNSSNNTFSNHFQDDKSIKLDDSIISNKFHLKKSKTIMIPKSNESFKKPLFTITPSSTLFNLPNNLINTQAIKNMVDPKSTVKIYYDDMIDEENDKDFATNREEKKYSSNTMKANELSFYEKLNKNNKRDILIKSPQTNESKLIRKEFNSSIEKEDVEENKNFKIFRAKKKTKPVNIEYNENKKHLNKTSNCRSIVKYESKEIIDISKDSGNDNQVIDSIHFKNSENHSNNENKKEEKAKEKEKIQDSENQSKDNASNDDVNGVRHSTKFYNVTMENYIAENMNDMENKLTQGSINKNKNPNNNLTKYNKNFSNRLNLKNKTQINAREIITHQDQIVKKDLSENFNTTSKVREDSMPSIKDENTVFIKNKNIFKKAQFYENHKNRFNFKDCVPGQLENLNSKIYNPYSESNGFNINYKNYLNDYKYRLANSKTKMFESLSKNQIKVPNNFLSHCNKSNKRLLSNKNTDKSINMKNTFSVDNVNNILFSKLKFGMNSKEFSNVKYNNSGLFSNFQKIKFSDFENSASPKKNLLLSKIDFGTNTLNDPNAYKFNNPPMQLSYKFFKDQKGHINAVNIDENVHNKFKNDVINKCLYNDTPKKNKISGKMINPTTTSFDISLLSKIYCRSSRSSFTKSRANFNIISTNDIKISKVDLNFFSKKINIKKSNNKN